MGREHGAESEIEETNAGEADHGPEEGLIDDMGGT